MGERRKEFLESWRDPTDVLLRADEVDARPCHIFTLIPPPKIYYITPDVTI